MTPAQADAELARFRPADGEQAALLAGHRQQVAAFPGDPVPGAFEGSALHRGGPSAHLTASALVVDPTGERTLLVLHRKAGWWMQPGGHLEAADASLLAAALREATEETGAAGLRPALGGAPADLHRHALSAAFGRCSEHLDVAFLLLADDDGAPLASEESAAVAWFAVDDLPDGVVGDLPPRLARARSLLRG